MSLRAPQSATRRGSGPRRRLPRRSVLAAACVAGGALAVPFGAGSSSASGTIGMATLVPSVDSGSDAVAMLEDAYRQSRTMTYHGVQVVMVDGESHQVQVSHVPGHTYLYAVGGQSAYEADDARAAVPSTDPLAKDPLALLKEHYRLSVARDDSLLGRPVVVIQATTGAGAVAAEFWVDRATRLLVRRDTFDGRHNVYGTVRYASLTVNAADPELAQVTATPLRTDGTAHSSARLGQLRSRGWWAQPRLPGDLSLYDAREVASASGGTVLHLSYSDGISTVSVFEQRGRLAGASTGLPAGWRSVAMPDGRRVVQADGRPVRAAWQAHDLVVAVIADVPPGQVTAVIDALPAGPAPSSGTGVASRVSRGLGRIGAKLNPFG